MFEIGIPNFITTKEYSLDPLKYGFFNTYKRGKYTLLVSHNGEFYSLMDIATTLKRFKIQSLFMIITKEIKKKENKKQDEYTILIGNSFYPYEKTLLHKSVIMKDENFKNQINKMKQLIDMVKKLLNTSEVIVFPIGVEEDDIKLLLEDNLKYKTEDITKYLILTPTVEPAIKKVLPILISFIIAGGFYYLSSYIDDYFQYDVKDNLRRELSKSKKKMYAQMDILSKIDKKNQELRQLLTDKSKIRVYRGN